MATHKPNSKKALTPKDMDERASLYSLPIEKAVAAILKAGRGDQPTMDSEKTA